MTITYHVGNSLYLNITNRCCCSCVFCIRMDHDGVGDGDSLWLDHEPGALEVLEALAREDLEEYGEVVFCGYGEPTESLEVLLAAARYIKETAPGLPVRLNTNGLGDRINGRQVAPLLSGLVDRVSISLNAPNASQYQEITRSAYGEESFGDMLRFARDCKAELPEVRFTVVDVLAPEEIVECQALADRMEIPLQIRVRV